jgi:hypothetical protein
MKSPRAILSSGPGVLMWQCDECKTFVAMSEESANDFRERTGERPIEAVKGPGLGVTCPCEEAEGVRVTYAKGERPGPGDEQLVVDVAEWRPKDPAKRPSYRV